MRAYIGDKDVAEWVPPLVSYQCTYVRAWITVKHLTLVKRMLV